jgi:hypothetical protein
MTTTKQTVIRMMSASTCAHDHDSGVIDGRLAEKHGLRPSEKPLLPGKGVYACGKEVLEEIDDSGRRG